MTIVQVIQGREITFNQLKAEFGLQRTEDADFFWEWQEQLPELKDAHKQALEDLKGDYLHLSTYPILEPVVKLVVLSPLLRLAGFYRPPFHLAEQQEVRIACDDGGKLSRGRIDILKFQPQFWTVGIESTTIQYSLDVGIPHTLFHMLTDAISDKPGFSFITNGIAFKFFKLNWEKAPQYDESPLFSIDRDRDLYTVVQILKHLAQMVSG